MAISLTSLFPRILFYTFFASICMWMAWFITHLPWISKGNTSNALLLGLVLLCWAIPLVLAGRQPATRPKAILTSTLSGMFSALIGLLILGSKLTEQSPEAHETLSGSTLKPNALLLALGFLSLGALLGVVSGFVGSLVGSQSRHDPEPSWLARFALLSACITAPLLFIGGLVTTTGSGMAVPDWPNSFGANMFLYPLGNAGVGVFLEHSHRLFGTLVGLAAIVTAVWTLSAEHRRWVKVLAVAVLALVIIQGVLGGQRVEMNARLLAMLHGILGQLTFALFVALAVVLAPAYQTATPITDFASGKKVRILLAAATHSTILQLVFGAMYRHFRDQPGGRHALMSHIVFSFVVVLTAILGGLLATKLTSPTATTNSPHARPLANTLGRIGTAICAIVFVQFLLGWAAFSISKVDLNTNPNAPLYAMIRTIHQANGAALLGVMTASLVMAKRLFPKKLLNSYPQSALAPA